jgi:hypothetical protein
MRLRFSICHCLYASFVLFGIDAVQYGVCDMDITRSLWDVLHNSRVTQAKRGEGEVARIQAEASLSPNQTAATPSKVVPFFFFGGFLEAYRCPQVVCGL